MSATEVGSLEQAAVKRKERLAALRAAKSKKQSGQDKEEKWPTPAFRSYKPVNDSLQEFVQPEPEIGEITDSVAEELKNENEGVVMESLDFTNLAPRKPDWDLKRDIAPKSEKLERRTQKAIAELIRERLKEEDLANAVTAGASAAQHLAEDED
jgi:coiled-coil domain-containing protein 12